MSREDLEGESVHLRQEHPSGAPVAESANRR